MPNSGWAPSSAGCWPGVGRVALVACLVLSASPHPSSNAEPPGVSALGVIDVAGSVMHLRLDEAGRRVLVSTVRYPEGGRRDELHLYELAGSGRAEGPVHRLTRDIDDVESVALATDGERIAVGCGPDVCIQRWGAEAIESRLAASSRRRELGSLAFRPDLGLLVAAQRPRMEIIVWDLADGARRQWAVASGSERLQEAFTPRLHGRPLWTPRWVGISPDGQRVASIRDDGTVSLWGRTGQLVKSFRGPYYADMDPAFTLNGALIVLTARDGGLSAVDAESERVLLTVKDRPSRSVRRAALLFGARVGYLAASRTDDVMLHTLPSGAVAATLAVREPVWRLAVSGDGRVVAIATQHRVTFWSLPQDP
jgi:WD40 repeat protein